MFKRLKHKLIMFGSIFKDTNDVNEQSVIGFISFMVMILIAIFDLVASWHGKDAIVHEFIFNSFFWLTMGTFGIAAGKNVFNNFVKKPTDNPPIPESEEQELLKG